jgi:hypothetical protein
MHIVVLSINFLDQFFKSMNFINDLQKKSAKVNVNMCIFIRCNWAREMRMNEWRGAEWIWIFTKWIWIFTMWSVFTEWRGFTPFTLHSSSLPFLYSLRLHSRFTWFWSSSSSMKLHFIYMNEDDEVWYRIIYEW